MSHVFVNTGQCGNQLGTALLGSLHEHLHADHPAHWGCFFRRASNNSTKAYARAVCIDTEPKVVTQCVERVNNGGGRGWLYDVKRVVYRHGGAGNNWAMGYAMCSGEFLDASLDSIRAELERCDRPPTLILTHSVAGGTGSGCGTRLTEALADAFADCTRVNLAVTPYHFGEVVVQHYNTVLCLAKVLACASALCGRRACARCVKDEGEESCSTSPLFLPVPHFPPYGEMCSPLRCRSPPRPTPW